MGVKTESLDVVDWFGLGRLEYKSSLKGYNLGRKCVLACRNGTYVNPMSLSKRKNCAHVNNTNSMQNW